jgi:hypothetical protein
MSAANKAKGTRNEIGVEEYLNAAGLKARKLPRFGSKDIGDVAIELKSGRVIVLELKDWGVAQLAEFLRQADVEAINYTNKYDVETYPMVQMKARRRSQGRSRITMEVDTLVNLLHWEGLS